MIKAHLGNFWTNINSNSGYAVRLRYKFWRSELGDIFRLFQSSYERTLQMKVVH
jgi:hypothetical protein